jgi:DNA-binding transcriptional LysR family regulator
MMKTDQLSRIDLNLLVLFQVVLEEEHVGRAAARLNLTASAVSHGLGRLRRLLNDPLFLRTPKGVVPTDRGHALRDPVADIIARVGAVMAVAEPFDPARSRRRFTIGAPDGASAILLTPLVEKLLHQAPEVDVGLVQVLPQPRSQPWQHVLDQLEARALDIAILPIQNAPPRFIQQKLFETDFVVTMRKSHPFARKPSLRRYCELRHVLVSQSGNSYGNVDEALAEHGLSRRVALTVPSFMMALVVLAETDFLGTLPRPLVSRHAGRFGLTTVELKMLRRSDPVRAIATRAAMMDAGIAWLVELLKEISARVGYPDWQNAFS